MIEISNLSHQRPQYDHPRRAADLSHRRKRLSKIHNDQAGGGSFKANQRSGEDPCKIRRLCAPEDGDIQQTVPHHRGRGVQNSSSRPWYQRQQKN